MNQLKTILLLGALSALVVAGGAALGPQWTWVALVIALGMNLFGWFFSDRLVLRMSGAREVSREEALELHRMVEELSMRAEIPKPRVYLIDAPHANAFATGRGPNRAAVAVTRGLLEILTPREVRGVLAHEIAHVAAFAGLGGSRDGEEGSGGGGLLFLLLAPVGATLVQLGISRQREYLADAAGARISGDPLALASALEKLHRDAAEVPAQAEPATASLHIVNPFAGLGGLMALFSTHPPAEERIRRLRALALETGRPGPLVRGGAWRRPELG